MIKKIIALILSAGMMLPVTAAMAEGETTENKPQLNSVFLCMQPGNSYTLVKKSDNDKLEYDSLPAIDDNGTKEKPFLSEQGYTYVPLRYIFEIIGLQDKEPNDDKYFKYNSEDESLTIKYGDTDTRWDKESKGTDTDEENNIIEYPLMIKVDGSYYLHLREISKLFELTTEWNEEVRNIYIYSDDNSGFLDGVDDDINGNSRIIKEKITTPKYPTYAANANQLNYSDIYINPLGDVQCLTSDLKNILKNDEQTDYKTYYSISRYENTLYFRDNNKCAFKYEPFVDSQPKKIKFLSKTDDSPVDDVLVDQMLYMNNHIYGIAVNSADDYLGKVFKANMDGKEFEYIHDTSDAFNIITYLDGSNWSISYVAGEDSNEIYNITDFKGRESAPEKLVDADGNDIVQEGIYFMVMSKIGDEKYIVYADDENGYIHQIKYDIKNKTYEKTPINKTLSEDNLTICSINADTVNSEGNVYFLYQDMENRRIVKQCSFSDISNIQDLNQWEDKKLIKLTVLNKSVYVTANKELQQIK